MKAHSTLTRSLLSVSLLALLPVAAFAQEASSKAPNGAADEETAAEIIVTGTSRSRVALDTPLAISQVNEQGLSRAGVSSQADILNTIPSIKADAGGGEVASNIFVNRTNI